MEIIIEKKNNISESFNSTLKKKISQNLPKIAYLVEELKYFSKEAIKKYAICKNLLI